MSWDFVVGFWIAGFAGQSKETSARNVRMETGESWSETEKEMSFPDAAASQTYNDILHYSHIDSAVLEAVEEVCL